MSIISRFKILKNAIKINDTFILIWYQSLEVLQQLKLFLSGYTQDSIIIIIMIMELNSGRVREFHDRNTTSFIQFPHDATLYDWNKL